MEVFLFRSSEKDDYVSGVCLCVCVHVCLRAQVRSALEEKIGLDMKNYKEFIDNEMMVTMAQMDKPSKLLEYLYLVKHNSLFYKLLLL